MTAKEFGSTIHNNHSLATTDKFHYMRRYLRGKAATTIASLQTTEACNDDGSELLKGRFGDIFRIEENNLFKLISVQPVSSSDRLGLYTFFDFVESHSRSSGCIRAKYDAYFHAH